MTIVLEGSKKHERTNASCVVCDKGILVARTYIEYVPFVDYGSPSPISDNIGTDADRIIAGYHCDFCGIKYQKLPGVENQPDVAEVLYFVEDIRKIRFRSKVTSTPR